MVRNLMPLGGAATLAVLDHQDLRLGPPLYDLASLLNDTLFPPPEAEEALLAAAAPTPRDRVRYHRAAAQRTPQGGGHLRHVRPRGADRHLPLIAPTLAQLRAPLGKYPGRRGLAARLAGVLESRPGASGSEWICYTGFAIGRQRGVEHAPGDIVYAFPRCTRAHRSSS